MSGWIKIEKDLTTDPRFLRMVRQYRNADVTQERSSERKAATQLLGCLTFLWCYADSHVREDDTLDLGPDEIDEIVGVEGFTQLMPTDWLEVVDAHSVKLPGFHAHNGTEAKKKALTQKRVARHRIREAVTPVAQAKRASVTQALPDQTRPDQKRTEEARASVPHGTFDGWAFVESRMKPHYPEGRFKQPDWIQASRIVEMLVIERGEDPELIAANVKLFRTEQDLDGNTGTKFVKKPSNWLADGSWKGPFHTTPKVVDSPEKIRMREAETREWADLTRRADASGFRAPQAGESMPGYRTLLQRHEAAARDRAKQSTAGPAPISALLPTRALA